MLRLDKYISKHLSVQLSLMIVLPIAMLLMVSLFIMLFYSREALREEAEQEAKQTLEGTAQQLDNILLSVEQASGNIYWSLQSSLNNPDKMLVFSKELVETNPYIVGCAIAFEPYYYKERGELFMAYFHRTTLDYAEADSSVIVQRDSYDNRPYNEQLWYREPLESGKACWINTMKDVQTEREAIVTFSLPLYGANGQRIGILAADVTLSTLSEVILSAKPSPNSYCTLLDSDGSFIVHPYKSVLTRETIAMQFTDRTDPALREAAKAMLSGETGSRFFREDGDPYYIFYKPFTRSVVPGRALERLNWSIGIIYPEDDIFDDYNRLIYYVLTIAVIALILLFVLCSSYTHRQLLPLRSLTESAQRIAEGDFNEAIPDSHQQDEIGLLQRTFQQMQQSLGKHVDELEQLTIELEEKGKELRKAYDKAQEADRMKTKFLHNMTNQMVAPANAISKDVDALCDLDRHTSQQETNWLANEIQQQGEAITYVLNHLLDMSNESSPSIMTEGTDGKEVFANE